MTTFVTAYLKVYEEEYDTSRTFENRLKHFMLLLELGINICIFVEPEVKSRFNELELKYKNIKVIQSLTISDLELYKIGEESQNIYSLPENKNEAKDTKNYIYLMLAKLEFLKKTIDLNPYNSNYFCWFDFSLPYIFKDTENTLIKIKNLSNATFKDDVLYIPGCWDFKMRDLNYLSNNIVWRFCGGFLIGDKQSIVNFYNASNDNFLNFLNETKRLVWEVNYWAWLENQNLISPVWYFAHHNDSIVDVPYNLNNE